MENKNKLSSVIETLSEYKKKSPTDTKTDGGNSVAAKVAKIKSPSPMSRVAMSLIGGSKLTPKTDHIENAPSKLQNIIGTKSTDEENGKKSTMVGNVDTAFYSTVSKGQKIETGDTVTNIAVKLISFMEKSHKDRLTNFEISQGFDKTFTENEQTRHDKLIQAITDAKKKADEESTDVLPTEKKSTKVIEPSTTPQKTNVASPAPKKLLTRATEKVVSVAGRVAGNVDAVGAGRVAMGIGGVALVGGISAAAALSIERETGKSSKDAIKNVGQIVPNDPEPGEYSYGIFGMNSKSKTIDSFIKQNPQLGITAKPKTKEFNDQWVKVSKEQSKDMLDAQLNWFDSNVSSPLKKDLSKLISPKLANDPSVLMYMSDRRVQYGTVMEKSALSHASNSTTSSEFINKMTEFDLANLQNAFPKYLSNHKNAEKGLAMRLNKRKEASLKLIGDKSDGVQLNEMSKSNKDLKATTTTNNYAVDNTTTNIIKPSSPPIVIIKKKNTQDLPMIIDIY